jgi:hypothetical protein
LFRQTNGKTLRLNSKNGEEQMGQRPYEKRIRRRFSCMLD